MEGLEPTRLSALEPKSSASTNFATSANSKNKFRYLEILFQVSFLIVFYNKNYSIPIVIKKLL